MNPLHLTTGPLSSTAGPMVPAAYGGHGHSSGGHGQPGGGPSGGGSSPPAGFPCNVSFERGIDIPKDVTRRAKRAKGKYVRKRNVQDQFDELGEIVKCTEKLRDTCRVLIRIDKVIRIDDTSRMLDALHDIAAVHEPTERKVPGVRNSTWTDTFTGMLDGSCCTSYSDMVDRVFVRPLYARRGVITMMFVERFICSGDLHSTGVPRSYGGAHS